MSSCNHDAWCTRNADAGRRPLRSHSNDIRKLLVPQTYNKLGDRSFSAAGPRLWNDLPRSTRTAAVGTFLRFLQTIFENTSLWRLKRLVTLSTWRYINKCIYLSIYLPSLLTFRRQLKTFLYIKLQRPLS